MTSHARGAASAQAFRSRPRFLSCPWMAAWLRPVALEVVRALASALSAAVVSDLDLTGKAAPACPAPPPCPGCPVCPACPEQLLLPILAVLGLLWLGSLAGAVGLLWVC